MLGLRGLIGQVGMQYTKLCKLFHRFRVLASKYCSPANFECDSGFRVYFLFNSFAKHCSSNLQLLLDWSVQYIDRKFNNQNVTNVTNKNPKSKICPVDRRRKIATICIYYVSKRGPNICKKQMFSLPKSANKLMKKLLQWRHQSSDLTCY